MAEHELTLETIAQGAANEVFQHLLQQVSENIADPNCEAEEVRKFSIEFVFNPFPDRTGALVEIRSKSNLVSINKVRANVYFEVRGSRIFAYPENPRQGKLYNEPKPAPKQ
jgi:hypothetical protein